MPKVEVRKRESFESALKRFKRAVEKAGVIAELRKREFYEKPSVRRKRELAAARKREQRRQSETSLPKKRTRR